MGMKRSSQAQLKDVDSSFQDDLIVSKINKRDTIRKVPVRTSMTKFKDSSSKINDTFNKSESKVIRSSKVNKDRNKYLSQSNDNPFETSKKSISISISNVDSQIQSKIPRTKAPTMQKAGSHIQKSDSNQVLPTDKSEDLRRNSVMKEAHKKGSKTNDFDIQSLHQKDTNSTATLGTPTPGFDKKLTQTSSLKTVEKISSRVKAGLEDSK